MNTQTWKNLSHSPWPIKKKTTTYHCNFTNSKCSI